MKILIMGLPGSGKTVLASHLFHKITKLGKKVLWFNADIIREIFDDWDFSHEGRIRQAKRMASLSKNKEDTIVICDFVAPIVEMRTIFNPDLTVWVDTITQGRFEDTNKLFENPEEYDIRVTEKNCEKWTPVILEKIFL